MREGGREKGGGGERRERGEREVTMYTPSAMISKLATDSVAGNTLILLHYRDGTGV